MKKLISLMLVAFVALATFGQYGTAYQFPVVAGDTITNTGTANKVITATGGYSDIAIQVVLTKVSGTAAGTVKVEGTLDGTNYYALGDTLAGRDAATVTKIFTHSGTPYVKYKVTFTGAGTMVTKWKVWYTLRKRQVQIAQ
jgi:hypothetical protein